jgi:hypothetical protein
VVEACAVFVKFGGRCFYRPPWTTVLICTKAFFREMPLLLLQITQNNTRSPLILVHPPASTLCSTPNLLHPNTTPMSKNTEPHLQLQMLPLQADAGSNVPSATDRQNALLSCCLIHPPQLVLSRCLSRLSHNHSRSPLHLDRALDQMLRLSNLLIPKNSWNRCWEGKLVSFLPRLFRHLDLQ